MWRNMLRILTLSILFAVGCADAYACQCMERNSPSADFRKMSVIFVGTAKATMPSDSRGILSEANLFDRRSVFSVVEAIKGVKSSEVDVYASSQSTACGMDFREGESFLVYASRVGDAKDDRRARGELLV